MPTHRVFGISVIAAVLAFVLLQMGKVQGPARVRRAATFDVSPPLASLPVSDAAAARPDCAYGCGVSPNDADDEEEAQADGALTVAAGAAVEQKSQGARPPGALMASFNGLGFGFAGPR